MEDAYRVMGKIIQDFGGHRNKTRLRRQLHIAWINYSRAGEEQQANLFQNMLKLSRRWR